MSDVSEFPVPTDDEIGPAMVTELSRFPALNIQRYLALEPECFDGWNRWLHGIYEMGLDPKLRELVICRIPEHIPSTSCSSTPLWRGPLVSPTRN